MGKISTAIRARLLAGAAAGVLALGANTAWAQGEAVSIPAQPLADALLEFANQTGRAIMFTPDVTASKKTAGVSGVADQQAALTQLLAGTGMTFRREGDAFVVVQAGEGGSSPQAAGAGNAIEALIVTAQKKEEAIQDVPIAISAFSQKSLEAQKLEGGFDLLKAIPNVTFSKSNFSGYNFSIRGIGTKAISATTDPGVAVSFNNTTLIVNRLFEQEYFDVERVEVLRGPQGTLYGRNATSGVINVLSARPRMMEFEGDLKLEAGNYNAQRLKGMINLPIGDTVAVRLAGALTSRDGYGVNEAAGTPQDVNGVSSDVDGRDLWSLRATVGWEPTDAIRVNALWERFEEDDNRVRTSKQLCHNDPGPATVGSFDWATAGGNEVYNTFFRSYTSQSCLPGSLYDDGAFGTPNGLALPYVGAMYFGPSLGRAAAFFAGGTPLGLGINPYFDCTLLKDSAAGDLSCNLLNGNLPTPLPNPPCEAAAYELHTPLIDVCRPDPYDGRRQSSDLRSIYSLIEPTYRAKSDVFELSIDLDITDSLTFTSQTVYATDEYYASQDYNRFTTFPIFADSSITCDAIEADFFGSVYPVGVDCSQPYAGGFYDITPGGVFTDPQLGPSSSLLAQDLSQVESEQFNQEFRLVSSFDAPWNFSLGANFTRFETMNDYYVFINALTALTYVFPFNTHNYKWCDRGNKPDAAPCIYVDPNPLESIDGTGHNYFRSANPYELNSSAIFGELYWQATDTLKVTLGARMTWDHKIFTPIPSQLLLYDYRQFVAAGAGPEACTDTTLCKVAGTGANDGLGARGSVANPDIRQEWREPTGRIIVDWKPDLSFTDETLLYGSIAHGYKGGGANPPSIAPPAGLFNARSSGVAAPPTFDPEFIDAYEIGAKNTLLNGALILNGSAFYYDYQGYQVSKIVDRSAANENFDAKLWGAELEWIFNPTRNLRFNGTFGHLQTEIAKGEQSIDLMDRTQSNRYAFTGPNGVTYESWVVLKPWITNSSNCIAPEAVVEAYLLNDQGNYLLSLCPGGGVLSAGVTPDDPGALVPGTTTRYNASVDAPNGGAGFYADLGGNELPNAPHWTASLGAQYSFGLPGGWDATLRSDFYWQSQSFARVYNTQYDKLRAWTNTNISLWVENPDWGVTAEVYVKNVFDETPITDAFLNSDDSGLTTNVFTLDPRVVGVSVRKSF